MNFFDHLKLAYRNKYPIIIITLLSLSTSYFLFLTQNKNQLDNTLLLSFAVQNQKPSTVDSSPYDNLQAADQITDSIQGWFLSPHFIDEINQKSQLAFSLKAKKQEKNNLLINFTADNSENSQKYSQQIFSSLQSRLNSYNAQSDLKINLAINEQQTSKKSSPLTFYLIIGLFSGLIFSYIFVFLWEELAGQVRTAHQVEAFLNRHPADNFLSESDLVKNHGYLIQMIKHNLKGENLQLLDLTRHNRFALEIVSKYTNYHQIKSYNLPEDLEKISLIKPTLIILELGHTKIKTLKRLAKLNLTHFESIVLDRLS